MSAIGVDSDVMTNNKRGKAMHGETVSRYAAGGAVDHIMGVAETAHRLAQAGEYHDNAQAEAYVSIIQWHMGTALVQRQKATARGDVHQAGEWGDAVDHCRWAVRALRAGVTA